MASATSSANATWLGYPEPQDTASIPRLKAEEAAGIIRQEQQAAQKSLLLIDVRRSDLTGHTIRGALNLPAHTFHPTRQTIVDILQRAASQGPLTVAVYCGSSQGRGPRCAGWLRDALQGAGQSNKVEVKVLEGGIKGFVKAYGDDEKLVINLPEEVKES